jgi:hypothetical protein
MVQTRELFKIMRNPTLSHQSPFSSQDIPGQILPRIIMEDINKSQTKIGKLKAIGNQIRWGIFFTGI